MEEFKLVPDRSRFFEFSPEEITVFFFLVGLTIEELLTIDELNVLANGLFELAQVLFMIASQRTLLNDAIAAQKKRKMPKKQKKTRFPWKSWILK